LEFRLAELTAVYQSLLASQGLMTFHLPF